MVAWSGFVEVLQGGLLTVSSALGGSMGWAIAVVSLAVRLALLPLTLRLALQALRTQRALRRLQPALESLRRRHGKDQGRLLEETGKLYEQHGVSILDGRSLVATVVQLPVLVGLFSAIRKGLIDGGRFLWVRDISSPDAALAALCGAVTAMAAAASPSLAESQRTILILLPALLTTFFLSKLAAGLSIYALSQALVGLLQSILLRRRAREIFAS
jgi:YidC/Oxa1 family membrane protein insertase